MTMTTENEFRAYLVTEKAGRFVAGRNNVGVGSVLTLTAQEAEYELLLGTIVPAETVDPESAEAGDGGQHSGPAPDSLEPTEGQPRKRAKTARKPAE